MKAHIGKYNNEKESNHMTLRDGEACGMLYCEVDGIVGVIRFGQPLILGELVKMRDTPDVCATIKEKFPGHKINVYPDASGQSNRTVNATDDIQ